MHLCPSTIKNNGMVIFACRDVSCCTSSILSVSMPGLCASPCAPQAGCLGGESSTAEGGGCGCLWLHLSPPPLMVCSVLFSAILVHSSWGIMYAVLQVCVSFLWYEGSWIGLQVFLIEGGEVWAPWGAWWLLRLSPLLPVSWSSSEATLLHHNQQENVPVWAAY